MFSNTGIVSFVLYGILILIAIIGMFIIIKLIKNENIKIERLDKITEIAKYTIASIAIATVTLIVSNLFKEREQDIKELEYFDKYVNDIKLADNVLVRYQLSKYLAAVSPKGDLKDAWNAYYAEQKLEYNDYLKTIITQKLLDTITNKTPAQRAEKEATDKKIEQFETPLVQTNSNIKPRVYLQIPDETKRDEAKMLQENLQSNGFTAPGVENVGKAANIKIPTITEVRYTRVEEYLDAEKIIDQLKEKGIDVNPTPQKVSSVGTRPGHFEVWFSKK
jgi:hypothetical protein